MKKIVSLLFVVVVSFMLFSCQDKNTTFDVTFMDGETVMSTVQVEENAMVTRPTDLETKSGYDFINWYSTPTMSHIFDFEVAITEDITIYAGFSLYEEDIRDWYVVGSGTSALLNTSNW